MIKVENCADVLIQEDFIGMKTNEVYLPSAFSIKEDELKVDIFHLISVVICVCVCVYVHVYVYVCMDVCLYAYICVSIFLHMCVHGHMSAFFFTVCYLLYDFQF
jgi:hypothetical protein